jgi:ubiquinone/menaquinone biosynthesis C-methylase UbiE
MSGGTPTDDVWERIFRERSWGRWPAEEVVRAVARIGRPGLRVLEVGCGAGAQLWYLAHEGHLPIGLDFAPAALGQAAARVTEEDLTVPLVRGDARALPFADASYDVVLDVEAWSCLPADAAAHAWREASRVLEPGGRVVSIGFTARTAGSDSGTQVDPHTVRDMTRGPLAELGTISFLDAARVDDLVASVGLRLDDVQVRTRTVGPEHELIEELVVVAAR